MRGFSWALSCWLPEADDDHLHGYDGEYGMRGDASIHGKARYVAVTPRDDLASPRNLEFRP